MRAHLAIILNSAAAAAISVNWSETAPKLINATATLITATAGAFMTYMAFRKWQSERKKP